MTVRRGQTRPIGQHRLLTVAMPTTRTATRTTPTITTRQKWAQLKAPIPIRPRLPTLFAGPNRSTIFSTPNVIFSTFFY